MAAIASFVATPVIAARRATKSFAGARVAAVSNGSRVSMAASWRPGSDHPAHLDGSMPGDFGFDPLYLGTDSETLKWYREAELQNGRWAMAAVAGVLAQEIVNPDVFFYEAAVKADLPFPILGVVAAQFLMMHYVEIRRWRDFVKPGSVDKDPLFAGNAIPSHEVGYPGGIFDPFGFAKGDIEELKLKEIKNARLAMLAWVGFVVQAQATGMGPIACWKMHLANPSANTLVAKGLVTGTTVISPGCAIPPVTTFQGIQIPTPCLPLWP
eukprot:CAMPEP_0118921014 /NCGR_PEP_ID=MMETSP1169-20130426/414_1 /TAXON_ID=36882 /ORGANISM="Pyramimonas obovata, Strain CCMP722" /LENGTH=267 /DNA_ID=CAMNT_0006861661 /DNA_START=74 /DNA_END=877 /DNA_ORIENTATION=-